MRTLVYILSAAVLANLPILAGVARGQFIINPYRFAAAGGGGTPAFVQDDGATFDPFGTARAVTFGSSTTTGNCIVAIFIGSNSSSLAVTDNKSNTYNRIHDGTVTGISIAIALNATGGASHEVTLTVTNTANPGHIIAMEFSSIAVASAVDDVDEENGFVANSSINLTTTVNNTLLLGVLNSNTANATGGTGFTLRHTQGTVQTESKVGVSSGANTVDFVHSERNADIVALALKPN